MDRSRSDRLLEDWDMLSKDAPRPPQPPREPSSRWLPAAAATLAAVIIIALAAGAIWLSRPGNSGVGTSPTPTPTTAVVSPSATPTAPSPSVSSPPSATAASPEPTDALGPFSCGFPITRPGSAAGASQAQPSAVRVGMHEGYDRIVFEYAGTVLPSLTIEPAQPPFAHDPSDLPMTVAGSAFLRLRLDGVAMGYAGQTDFKPGYPALVELARQGDFEGVQSWIVGLSKASCVRVLALSAPARLVIDIQH